MRSKNISTFLGYLLSFMLSACLTLEAQPIDKEKLPAEAIALLDDRMPLNVSNAPLKEVFRAISTAYGLNIIIEDTINQPVTLHLSRIPVIDALLFLCEQYNLHLTQKVGGILKVEKNLPPSKILIISYQNGFLAADLKDDVLADVLHQITSLTGQTIVPGFGVKGKLTGYIEQLPLESGLTTLLNTNGFSLFKTQGVWYVDYSNAFILRNNGSGQEFSRSRLQVEDGKISLNVANLPIEELLENLRRQLHDTQLIVHDLGNNLPSITVQVENMDLDACLTLIFKGSPLTYYKQENIYVIARKDMLGVQTTKTIRLSYAKASSVHPLMSNRFTEPGRIEVLKELNGFLVTGSSSYIDEVSRFIKEIDVPTPQIMIEALVVDFSLDKNNEFGFFWGSGNTSDSLRLDGSTQTRFGTVTPVTNTGYTLQGGRHTLAAGAQSLAQLLGLSITQSAIPIGLVGGMIARLPQDFYFRIQALAQEGKANVRSRPQLSTISGSTATLSFGQTQYYLLNTSSYYGYPYNSIPNGNNTTTNASISPIVTQQFQTIEANVNFEITPWVGTSGEITAEIKPDFKTPQGGFKQGVPPTINTRSLNATVRLHDGETIVLGGLIEEMEQLNINKVPLLGSIPLLGKLFRNKKKVTKKQELIIFVTPYIFYGGGRDHEQWQNIQNQYDYIQEQQRRLKPDSTKPAAAPTTQQTEEGGNTPKP